MRIRFFIPLAATIALGITYWYQTTAAICPVPIHYRIGEVNESFELTHEQVLDYVQKAEFVWEDAVKRDLFVYDENADFTIDFVYDERQEQANEEQTQRQQLDAKLTENERILKIVEELQTEYQKLSDTYKTRLADYEDRLNKYNAEVGKYNDRGGAPADVFAELETERVSLESEERELSRLTDDLNDFVTKINELSDRGNDLINTYNREVNQYNKEFGFRGEFTQGDYHDGQIRIYTFSEENELLQVLAHEFGHALGLGHIDDEASLMYYLLQDVSQPPALSSDDLTSYYTTCGAEETFEQRVRRVIRNFY